MLNIVSIQDFVSKREKRKHELTQSLHGKAAELEVLSETSREITARAFTLMHEYYDLLQKLQEIDENIELIDVVFPQQEFDF